MLRISGREVSALCFVAEGAKRAEVVMLGAKEEETVFDIIKFVAKVEVVAPRRRKGDDDEDEEETEEA